MRQETRDQIDIFYNPNRHNNDHSYTLCLCVDCFNNFIKSIIYCLLYSCHDAPLIVCQTQRSWTQSLTNCLDGPARPHRTWHMTLMTHDIKILISRRWDQSKALWKYWLKSLQFSQLKPLNMWKTNAESGLQRSGLQCSGLIRVSCGLVQCSDQSQTLSPAPSDRWTLTAQTRPVPAHRALQSGGRLACSELHPRICCRAAGLTDWLHHLTAFRRPDIFQAE